MSVITLTTDFGTADWFVGTIKGVIASLAPKTSWSLLRPGTGNVTQI
jgi:S-adenosylmethionine hydrolase